jgi:hypothetical protein
VQYSSIFHRISNNLKRENHNFSGLAPPHGLFLALTLNLFSAREQFQPRDLPRGLGMQVNQLIR